jgi:hypothetical protein
VTADDYWVIVDAIDNGWPIAIEGIWWDVPAENPEENGNWRWPPQGGIGHYIAIKGYSYYQSLWGGMIHNRQIECTDSYCPSDSLWLDWNTVVEEGMSLEINIIKDEIPEDFEWGINGDPLSDDGGDVNWTITADGDSYAKISSWGEHSGERCGKFYYDGDPDGYNYVRGYYSEVEPIWRGFWFRTDGDAVPHTRTGDGSHSIVVRVLNDDDDDGDGKLQYYDGGWKDAGCELNNYTWYFIEFRAIEWDSTYKYDIFVNGDYVKGGAHMHTESAYNGITAYYGAYYEGSFWIDDIPSSWW